MKKSELSGAAQITGVLKKVFPLENVEKPWGATTQQGGYLTLDDAEIRIKFTGCPDQGSKQGQLLTFAKSDKGHGFKYSEQYGMDVTKTCLIMAAGGPVAPSGNGRGSRHDIPLIAPVASFGARTHWYRGRLLVVA